MFKIIILTILASSILFPQNIGDTIIVKTITYKNPGGASGIRDTMIDFSNLPDVSFEKVIMRYNMRCKDNLISDGANRNRGCGEWDYSCNTYIHDSTKVDSVKVTSAEYLIAGFSENEFNYTDQPTFDYRRFYLNDVIVNNVEDASESVTGNESIENFGSIPVQNISGRNQILYKAENLIAAGVEAGEISGIKLNILNGEGNTDFLKIKLKNTSSTFLDPNNLENSGLNEVYFNHYNFVAGSNELIFRNPFEWDGSSNLLIDITFHNKSTQNAISIASSESSEQYSISNETRDNYLHLSGRNAYLEIDSLERGFSNGFTFACWVRVDNLNRWSRFFDFGNGNPNNNILLAINNQTNNLNFNTYNENGSTSVQAQDVISVGEWQHIVATISENGDANIYINGVSQASGTLSMPNNVTRENCYIGRSNWPNDLYLNAGIDDISIWDKGLSAEEVKSLINGKVDPGSDGLIVNYDFDSKNDFAENRAGPTLNGSFKNAPLKKLFRGEELFKNFISQESIPNITILQGNYDISVQNVETLDSIMLNPYGITRFEVEQVIDGFENDKLMEKETFTYWKSEVQRIYNGWSGLVVGTRSAPEVVGTIVPGKLERYNRYPSKLEIMSFVTPYGIGLDFGENGKTWEFDVTDFLPIFNGKKRMTMERGGQRQEEMDIQFYFIVGTPPRNVNDISQVWRVESRGYSSINDDRYYEPRNILLDENSSFFTLKSAITGHGQQGEFIPREHYVYVGQQFYNQWTVWTECSDNPVYPQGGTWVYDRAGWCPGAATDIMVSDLTPFVTPGENTLFDYNVAVAAGDSRYIVNHQLVSYGEINHKIDARILEVREPSDRVEFARFNSICHDPVVTIQNTGSDNLESATIRYWANNSQDIRTFEWTGELAFNEKENVILTTTPDFWMGLRPGENVFHVEITNPNGIADEYPYNDHYASKFTPADVLPADIVVWFRTNSQPQENEYSVTDEAGNILLERRNMMSNTTYRDTLKLETGCYTYNVIDSDQDGISWWANNDGQGATIISQVGGDVLKEFNPDFGAGVHYNFSVNYPLSYEDFYHPEPVLTYPNPSDRIINFKINGFGNKANIKIYNSSGQIVLKKNEISNSNDFDISIDINDLPKGFYYVEIHDGKKMHNSKFIKK